MRSSRFLVVALISAMACRATSAPLDPGNGVLTTDAREYVAVRDTGSFQSYRIRVITSFFNQSDSTKHLDRCFPSTPYPIYGVALVTPSNPEGAAWNPNWGCVGILDKDLIAIPPHSSRVDTLNLSAPNSADGATGRPYGAFEGRFRIGYGGELSNEFVIRLP